jgi:hypothetical protein
MFGEVNYLKEKRKKRLSQKNRKKTTVDRTHKKNKVIVRPILRYDYGCED